MKRFGVVRSNSSKCCILQILLNRKIRSIHSKSSPFSQQLLPRNQGLARFLDVRCYLINTSAVPRIVVMCTVMLALNPLDSHVCAVSIHSPPSQLTYCTCLRIQPVLSTLRNTSQARQRLDRLTIGRTFIGGYTSSRAGGGHRASAATDSQNLTRFWAYFPSRYFIIADF